jgi:sporulation protein YlmC with PRC-barrel domain
MIYHRGRLVGFIITNWHLRCQVSRKKMSELETLTNKKVISSDLQEIGNVVSSDKHSLVIMRGADNHYIIPKSRVEAFIGDDMVVDFRFNDLLLVELASLSYID